MGSDVERLAMVAARSGADLNRQGRFEQMVQLLVVLCLRASGGRRGCGTTAVAKRRPRAHRSRINIIFYY